MSKEGRILFLSDRSRWVTAWEQRAVQEVLSQIGVKTRVGRVELFGKVYFSDRYQAARLAPLYKYIGNLGVFDYFHGDPRISPDSGPILKKIVNLRDCFYRIRVSHSGMESLLESSGLGSLVFRIPIGLKIEWFPQRTQESREKIRRELGIPSAAVVVGSFQKDGEGWGDGSKPKIEKGPDILLDSLDLLAQQIPELFVLLTGPSRGFVKTGLARLKIPFKHIEVPHYPEIGLYYHALDGYLISSRDEGGPKAVLEAMATGVPLVSTRVGQAQDLIKHGENGWLADSGASEELADLMYHCLSTSQTENQIHSARLTAERNAYDRQYSLWRDFFEV